MSQYDIDEKLAKCNYSVSLNGEVDTNTIDTRQKVHTSSLEERLQPLYNIFTKKQATVFNEHFLYGKTLEEIANTYDVSINAIWKTKKQIEKTIGDRYTEAKFAELIEMR